MKIKCLYTRHCTSCKILAEIVPFNNRLHISSKQLCAYFGEIPCSSLQSRTQMLNTSHQRFSAQYRPIFHELWIQARSKNVYLYHLPFLLRYFSETGFLHGITEKLWVFLPYIGSILAHSWSVYIRPILAHIWSIDIRPILY